MLHDHQHGSRDVTCKPAIANRPLPHSCKQRHRLEARGGKIQSTLSKTDTFGTGTKCPS